MRRIIIFCLIAANCFLGMSASAQTGFSQTGFAQAKNITPGKKNHKRIVREVPGPNERITHRLIRVSASQTPSGLPVPRFVSLKYSKSFGRTGPSKAHKVQWTYKRRGLPMIIVAETEMWRKVRDIAGEESWMHKSLLSGKKMVLARTGITLRARPDSGAKARAIAAKGALLQLEECEKSWCLLKSENGELSGYAPKSLLWGAGPL